MKLLRDTWLIFQRQILLVLRNPVWVIIGIVQPLYFLFLFGPLMKKALQFPTDTQAYQFFIPGLLVMLAMFGSMFVGFGLIAELRAGVIERSRVTPISRLSLMLGRSLRDVVTLFFQAILITVLAIPFGLVGRARQHAARLPRARPHRADAVGGLQRARLEAAQRGRAGPADERRGPADPAAVRHPAPADAWRRRGCEPWPTTTRSPGR
jgi:hypothetical protein